ncbi:hypothetical protein IE53DRAFT_386668 [Violaceomyces palustris]|uniref:Uncharacterized protein n=1 Tax=Violaceomyces palustris TaxID=1673888 RepID=A0ACD0NYU9_9BASI|nr:hypothetical protein IE53DRAFT_386668 [Violaceomyces palustris]
MAWLRSTHAVSYLLVAALILQVSVRAAQTPFLPVSADKAHELPHAANFSGHSLVRFQTNSLDQLHTLLSEADQRGLDVWSARKSKCSSQTGSRLAPQRPENQKGEFGCVDIRLPPKGADADDLVESLSSRVTLAGGSRVVAPPPTSQTIIDDIQILISEQEWQTHLGNEGRTRQPLSLKNAQAYPGQADDTWHDGYHNYDDISNYLSELAAKYPDHASKVEIGQTHEGRAIIALKVGSGQSHSVGGETTHENVSAEAKRKGRRLERSGSPGNDGSKIGFVISAEQHAREWISTSTALFFADKLLQVGLSDTPSDAPWTKEEALQILDTFDLTIIPLSNPDGYAYTWENNRMWRKNRQPNEKFPGFCDGVDINRNWGFHFASSLNPCSESYAGSEPFSAAEPLAISSYISDPANKVKGYVDLHSYGQLLMFPYSYSCQAPLPDEEDLTEVALGAVKALRDVHKRSYTSGKICEILYDAAGSSIDWSYGQAGLKWSFALELRDSGTYGFLLPPSEIRPTGEEVGSALVYILSFIAKKERR